MIIKVNDIDITSRLLSFKTSSEMNSDSLIMGNAVCKKLELTLDNHDGELVPLLDYPFFVYYSQDKALGEFNVYEKPEKYTGTITLTLYDNMYFFNQRYDTKLDYKNSVTVRNQLEEMKSLTGVNIDTSGLSTDTLNKIVEWYDNTVSMRNYIGWIAELDGCNTFADETGKIIFRDLATGFYNTVDIEDYQKGELVTVTRICFDDGILKLEAGDSSGNTLYLSSNNPYIDSNVDLQIILDKYQYLTFYSVKDVKMASIDNMYLTDLILYNGEFLFMPMSVTEVYGGGQYSIASISGEISTVNNEMTVNKTVDPSVKIRRLQTIVDQNAATLQIVAEQSGNNADEIGKLIVSTDEISIEVKKKVGEDEIISKINQTAEAIKILAKFIQLEGIITANGNIIVKEDGSLEAKNGKFTGKVEGSSFYTEKTTEYTYTESDKEIVQNLIMDESTPTAAQLAKYDLDLNGLITAKDYVRMVNVLDGKYGNTGGKATFVDKTSINLEGSGKIVTERYLNGTRVEYMEFNAGSIMKSGNGTIYINGEPVITEISGTIARFG